jgi:hypothetical protein
MQKRSEIAEWKYRPLEKPEEEETGSSGSVDLSPPPLALGAADEIPAAIWSTLRVLRASEVALGIERTRHANP